MSVILLFQTFLSCFRCSVLHLYSTFSASWASAVFYGGLTATILHLPAFRTSTIVTCRRRLLLCRRSCLPSPSGSAGHVLWRSGVRAFTLVCVRRVNCATSVLLPASVWCKASSTFHPDSVVTLRWCTFAVHKGNTFFCTTWAPVLCYIDLLYSLCGADISCFISVLYREHSGKFIHDSSRNLDFVTLFVFFLLSWTLTFWINIRRLYASKDIVLCGTVWELFCCLNATEQWYELIMCQYCG